MRQDSMKVLFAIKKSSLMKNGEVPIIIRITIDGVCDEARIQEAYLLIFGIKRKVAPRAKTETLWR